MSSCGQPEQSSEIGVAIRFGREARHARVRAERDPQAAILIERHAVGSTGGRDHHVRGAPYWPSATSTNPR